MTVKRGSKRSVNSKPGASREQVFYAGTAAWGEGLAQMVRRSS